MWPPGVPFKVTVLAQALTRTSTATGQHPSKVGQNVIKRNLVL